MRDKARTVGATRVRALNLAGVIFMTAVYIDFYNVMIVCRYDREEVVFSIGNGKNHQDLTTTHGRLRARELGKEGRGRQSGERESKVIPSSPPLFGEMENDRGQTFCRKLGLGYISSSHHSL